MKSQVMLRPTVAPPARSRVPESRQFRFAAMTVRMLATVGRGTAL
jgi:hypothetical protein